MKLRLIILVLLLFAAVLDASPTGINVVQARGGRGAGGGDAGSGGHFGPSQYNWTPSPTALPVGPVDPRFADRRLLAKPLRRLLGDSGPASWKYSDPSEFRHGWLKEQIRGSVVSKPAVGAIPADRFDKPERRLLDSGPASHQYAHPSEFRRHNWWKAMARSSVVGKPDDGEGGIPDSRFERPQRRLMDSGPDSHQYSDPSEYRYGTLKQTFRNSMLTPPDAVPDERFSPHTPDTN